MNGLKFLGGWFRRLGIYFAVLRPCFLIALIILYLPLTAADWMYGNSMLGNLFVDYDLKKAFWFGFAVSGAVWALMLTSCLTLDFARDRQEQQDAKQRWIPDPGQENRWVTIPISRKRVFWLFTLLGAPAAIVVIWKATSTSLASLRGLETLDQFIKAMKAIAVPRLCFHRPHNRSARFLHSDELSRRFRPDGK
jgi:hypothetical protein